MIKSLFWVASGLVAMAAIVCAVQGVSLLFCLGVLLYVGLALWVNREAARGQKQTGVPAPEEAAILKILQEQGRAQRQDLLAVLGMSRSGLGRILDGMETKGLIEQIGERKASYYVLKDKNL